MAAGWQHARLARRGMRRLVATHIAATRAVESAKSLRIAIPRPSEQLAITDMHLSAHSPSMTHEHPDL